MKKITLSNVVARSQKIRARYHEWEMGQHGSQWTIGEDALGFLTDAGLVGRLTMVHQGRWPMEKESAHELEHKLGECMWWLIVLAERMELGAEPVIEAFLTRTEHLLNRQRRATRSRSKVKKPAKSNHPKTTTLKRKKN